MSTHVQQIKQVSSDGRLSTRTTRVDEDTLYTGTANAQSSSMAARVIWYVAGIVLTLLAFRFILTLLGANSANAFAGFIYNVSHPFVSPFFNLFGYNLQYGVSRFETFTLVAMIVYTAIAWGLARLVTLKRDAVADSRIE
jgi:uncharacterized protein YggT (Ycf19 family)